MAGRRGHQLATRSPGCGDVHPRTMLAAPSAGRRGQELATMSRGCGGAHPLTGVGRMPHRTARLGSVVKHVSTAVSRRSGDARDGASGTQVAAPTSSCPLPLCFPPWDEPLSAMAPLARCPSFGEATCSPYGLACPCAVPTPAASAACRRRANKFCHSWAKSVQVRNLRAIVGRTRSNLCQRRVGLDGAEEGGSCLGRKV